MVCITKGASRIITVENVTKVYENASKGLDSVSLSITQGEFVFIVGSSGSGKTTLVRLLLKEIEPNYGKLIVNGEDLSQLTSKQMPYYRRRMGVVFQDFRLLSNKTVYDNVAFAMQILGASSRDIRRSVPSVLALVGLSRKAKSYPNQLSGGEQQRTALARAIVNKPPLLLADEPTGNLDPDTSWEIMTLLEDINNRGTTVVVATHAKEIVDEMQKRVVTLRGGVVIGDIKKGGYSSE
ncbi:MAG: cell division ATP-binding protein FtsE [Clostridiales bacterium]|jgi:cell division transport system ATP-binding protein|nr:cell division ATP-binding protein FtsE [Clostridiales bacterium]